MIDKTVKFLTAIGLIIPGVVSLLELIQKTAEEQGLKSKQEK